MHQFSLTLPEDPRTSIKDEYLFGWDPTPAIVSVWARRDGRAVIWTRDGERINYTQERFRPWLLGGAGRPTPFEGVG